ncbi:IQ motif and SEC7 domain-containing protein 3-like [Leucoraja erinacea]|uniref:IQ motif and SEC7 domain-containing protein 3-like n=1 Tax=Leucoraja erinaceus TaxID=7782 RepID=UPI002454FCE3|nr:IQ motif and SEC7 domain-containing protein 3-like [Leucoraja erinacea]
MMVVATEAAGPDSAGDPVKCPSAEAKACRMVPLSSAMLQKASLHHTASPMRMQRGKGTAACSHQPASDYELSLDLKNKQVLPPASHTTHLHYKNTGGTK